MPTVTSHSSEGTRRISIADSGRDCMIEVCQADLSDRRNPTPANVTIVAPNARSVLPDTGLEARDATARQVARDARQGATTLMLGEVTIQGEQARAIAKNMGLTPDIVATIEDVYVSKKGNTVSFGFKEGTTPQQLQKATDALVHHAASKNVVPRTAIPEIAETGLITREPVRVGVNRGHPSSTRIDVPRSHTTTGSGFTLFVDSASGNVSIGLVRENEAHATAAWLSPDERSALRKVAETAGIPLAEIDRQLNDKTGRTPVLFETGKKLGEVGKTLSGGVVGKETLSGIDDAVKQHGVQPNAERTHHGNTSKARAHAGNIVAQTAAGVVLATGAGIAAAAQAPEGKRLEAGVKAAGKELAEDVLPGITETDTCKKIGANVGRVGSTGAAIASTVFVAKATAATTLPTGGFSLAIAATKGPAFIAGATILGGEIGQRLGEAGCNLVRDAVNTIAADNKAQIAHKPTKETVASNKTPDATSARPTPAAGRG